MKYFLLMLICISSLTAQNHIFPVELVYFNAIVSNGIVLLSWSTATEVNNYGFYVERSDISMMFNTIGFVIGSGNSNAPKNYLFVDSTLINEGRYFYRLKQIDIDGHFQFSDTIEINYNLAGVGENWNKEEINFQYTFENGVYAIKINNKKSISGDLLLYSILGEKIFETHIEANKRTIIIPANYSSGVYVIILTSNSKIIQMKKVVVVK
ncbi:MAG: hypothetical protein WHS65_02150 [Melioribacteraceae bacterium]